jgi:uncharacterized protein YdaU (DUF1376 family)
MTSRPTAFMPLWIGDYLADTTHLSTDQHGAYLLLLMAYWRRGGPLPADDAYLCRIVGMTVYKWRGIRPTIVAFFEERDGVWISKRSDEELVKAETRYGKRAAAGRKGGSAPKVGGRKIVYSAPLAASSALPIAANEAERVETAETSHSEPSNASSVLEAGLKQSQSQPQTKRTGTTVSSNQESLSLVEPLLVCSESKTLPAVIPVSSKPISSKRNQGSRWPADAVVPDDWIAEAAERRRAHGKPVIDLLLEAEKFQNFWSAKSGAGATKLDWRATWRNWTLNAHGAYGNGKGQFGARGTIDNNPRGNFAAIADRLRADREGRETFDA